MGQLLVRPPPSAIVIISTTFPATPGLMPNQLRQRHPGLIRFLRRNLSGRRAIEADTFRARAGEPSEVAGTLNVAVERVAKFRRRHRAVQCRQHINVDADLEWSPLRLPDCEGSRPALRERCDDGFSPASSGAFLFAHDASRRTLALRNVARRSGSETPCAAA
jgi:hypothetical protein